MNRRPLVIIGAGGHGREIHDIAEGDHRGGVSWEVIGYLDDAPDPLDAEAVTRRGSAILGPIAAVTGLPPLVQVVLGIGAAPVRRRIAALAHLQGRPVPVLVHADATVGSDTELGPGTVLWAGARISTGVRTGRHVHVNHNATVGHDSVLADFVTLNPAAAVSGRVRIGPAATVGANAFVHQGLAIGEAGFVGAGAAVVRAVPGGVVVRGVPAR